MKWSQHPGRMSLIASQAGENSQTNDPEHTIVSSILTDLIFRRNHERRAVLSEPYLNRQRSWDRATLFKTQNRHNNSINSNINTIIASTPTKILILDLQKLKTKQLSLIDGTHQSKSFAEKSMNRTSLAQSKLITTDLTMIQTITFNSETSLRIRSRKNMKLL